MDNINDRFCASFMVFSLQMRTSIAYFHDQNKYYGFKHYETPGLPAISISQHIHVSIIMVMARVNRIRGRKIMTARSLK
jgi:hypothetical protein